MAALALGVVFAASGVAKAVSPKGFVDAVAEFDILPARASGVFAAFVIPAELVVSAMLLTATSIGAAALVASALLFAFLVGVAVNLMRRRTIECNCFGVGGHSISRNTVLRLALMLSGAACVALESAIVKRDALWSSANVIAAGVVIIAGSWALIGRAFWDALSPCRSCGGAVDSPHERAEGVH